METGTDYVKLAQKSAQLGNHAESVAIYTQLAKDTQLTPEIYASIGKSLNSLGQHQQAIHYGLSALKMDPYSGSAHKVAGQSYSALGKFKKALEHYNFTIEQSKQHSNPHQLAQTMNLKAHSLFNLGQIDHALECNKQALELNPHNIVLYLDRAKMFLEMEQTQQALELYDRVIKKWPFDFYPQMLRGNLYRARGELKKALKDYSKAYRQLKIGIKGLVVSEDQMSSYLDLISQLVTQTKLDLSSSPSL